MNEHPDEIQFDLTLTALQAGINTAIALQEINPRVRWELSSTESSDTYILRIFKVKNDAA